MSADVVYSEVVFVNRNKVEDPDQCRLGEASQASRKTKPCGDRVRLLLAALLALLTAGLIALSVQYVYTEKKLKDLQQLYSALNENFTVNACPKDWEYHGGKCYLFSTNAANWTESRDTCVSNGGHLVIINSKDEQEFLINIIKPKYKDEFWIGLTDEKEEGKWLWVDNTPLNTSISYWIDNEPDDWKGTEGKDNTGEDCVIIVKPESIRDLSSWSDGFCSRSFRRICETRSSRQT